MAMMPFCGYNMGDYFSHWIKMGKMLGKNAPKIFNVNWFKTNEKGDFIWPGYGENIRVLDWILDRCENKTQAKSTPIGYMPHEKDINLEKSGVRAETLSKLLEVDTNAWLNETEKIKEFYSIFKEKLPQELQDELKFLNSRLKNN